MNTRNRFLEISQQIASSQSRFVGHRRFSNAKTWGHNQHPDQPRDPSDVQRDESNLRANGRDIAGELFQESINDQALENAWQVLAEAAWYALGQLGASGGIDAPSGNARDWFIRNGWEVRQRLVGRTTPDVRRQIETTFRERYTNAKAGRSQGQTWGRRPSPPPVSEAPVDSDTFILDVLQFFFQERLQPTQLNDHLRRLAAYALNEAIRASSALDFVPRPPSTPPSITWLVGQAVQIAFRRIQREQGIYESVRTTVQARLRSEYELAKMDVSGALSFRSRAFGVNNLSLSSQGLEFIKQFEGFRGNLYNDVAGHCTIGYGHLVHRGNCNGTESAEFISGITQQRATELLREAVRSFEQTVNDSVNVTLNQNQFDALISFSFNVGAGAFRSSTLLRLLNTGNYDVVPTELRKWVNAGGRPVQGLIRRREAESNLFTNARYSSGQSFYNNAFEATNDSDIDDGERLDGNNFTVSLTVPSHCPINAATTASTAHFTINEFRSHDGVDVPVSIRGNVQALMEQLEVLRTEVNKPIRILSGYRSPEHNRSVGGATRSQHLCGQAADIQIQGMTPTEIHALIESLIASGRMRQGGLGLYNSFVHYDIRGTRTRWSGNGGG